MEAGVNFETAFKYPFNRPAGMLNILWIFLPIFGWFALIGYTIRLVKNWIKKDFKELPKFAFGSDMSFGFFMFLKGIPFWVAYGIINQVFAKAGGMGLLANLFLGLFIVPMLAINFFNKETISSYFEFAVIKPVFDNFGDYVVVLLKSLALQVIFLVMIIVLVGIPAGAFTKNLFMADFYRRNVLSVKAK